MILLKKDILILKKYSTHLANSRSVQRNVNVSWWC